MCACKVAMLTYIQEEQYDFKEHNKYRPYSSGVTGSQNPNCAYAEGMKVYTVLHLVQQYGL